MSWNDAVRIDALRGLLCTYAALILYATLLPFHFRSHVDLRSIASRVAWDPFQLGGGTPTPLFDVVANVGFFVPIGLLSWATRHAWRVRPGSTRAALAASAAIGALLSLGVEATQIWTSSRTPATSDVLANTAGALLGALAAAGLGALLRSERARALRGWIRQEPLAVPLLGLIALYVLHATVPFDLTWHPHDWLRAAERVRFLPWQERSINVLPLDPLLLSALLGGLADRAAGRRYSGSARVVRALGMSFAIAIGMEMLQLGISSRTTSWFEVAGAFVGGVTGIAASRVLAAQRSVHDPTRRIAIVYALSLAVISLYPIESPLDATDLRARVSGWFSRAAFPEAASRGSVHELLNVLLLYVPFGYLTAASRRAPRDFRWGGFVASAIGPCSAVALGLGILRAALPGGEVAPGHVIPATLGGLVGAFMWLWRSDLDAAVPALRAQPSR
jgi:glycopeptide antibiotics resistance protein